MCKENMLCRNRLCANYTIECATLRSLPVLQKKQIQRNHNSGDEEIVSLPALHKKSTIARKDSSDDEEIIPALEPVQIYQKEELTENIESIQVLVGFEDQIRRITKYLHEIRDFGNQVDVTNLVNSSGTAEKMKALVNRKSLQTIAEIGDLKDDLENVVKDKISARQMELLGFNDDNADGEVKKFDPSVEFFGMECEIVIQKVAKIGTGVRIFKQKLIRNKQVDVLLLSSILEKIDSLEIEVGLHAKAISTGCQAVKNQDNPTFSKIIESSSSGPTSLSKSQSFRTNNARAVKYKMNKTDTVYSAQSHHKQTNQNKQEDTPSSHNENRKDSNMSFLYNVAMLFNKTRY